MTEHPITPSPELVEQWDKGWDYKPGQQVNYADYIATQAARWGADQELEACCEWFKNYGHLQRYNHYDLRAARRPKEPMTQPDYRSLFATAIELWDADCDMDSVIEKMREALSQPQHPAGEVGELVAWLLDEAEQAANSDSPVAAGMLTWAAQVAGEHADLLEQLAQSAPQPIPVSERLPGPEDCDAEGRCWAWRSHDPEEDDLGDFWQLIPCEWLGGFSRWTHWLPAHALPLPAAEVSDG